MYSLNIRLLAKEDIQEIVDYYDEKVPTVTDKFLTALFSDIELLKKNPLLFEKKYRDTRVRFMKHFPFGVHYRLVNNKVEILAVLHTSRNPKIWEER
ncbi:MAG: hypothetical protein DRI89_02500 [Bacteroidetes bacterium]|nr:MAG: hypothetical protein DRI89_02500 [Bacteroidota bacterium]